MIIKCNWWWINSELCINKSIVESFFTFLKHLSAKRTELRQIQFVGNLVRITTVKSKSIFRLVLSEGRKLFSYWTCSLKIIVDGINNLCLQQYLFSVTCRKAVFSSIRRYNAERAQRLIFFTGSGSFHRKGHLFIICFTIPKASSYVHFRI